MTPPKIFPAICPMASSIREPKAMSAGSFVGGRPQGVTIHYLADRNIDRACRSLVQKGLGYHLIINRDGAVIQTTYFSERVNHAGKALWNNKSPNKSHAAVALSSWGLLEQNEHTLQYESWSGESVDEGEVVFRPSNTDGKEYPWDKATDAQENSLREILRWFCINGINPVNICGHDECALPSGRKIDPGGVLSHPIPEFVKSMFD